MSPWNAPGQLPTERSGLAIEGFRAWRLVRTAAGAPRLAPATPRSVWEPGRAPSATCSGSHARLYVELDPCGTPHRAPDKFCTCGYHAARDPASLVSPGGPASVVGTVALWGRVIEHTKGWRSEFAYPARLRLTCPWCVRIGDWPALPDVVLAEAASLKPCCAAHVRLADDGQERLDVEGVQERLLHDYGLQILPLEALPPPDRVRTLTMARRIWDRRRTAKHERPRR